MFLYLAIGFVIGLGGGYLVRLSVAKKKTGNAEAKADAVLKEAKEKEKKYLLEAQEKSIKIIEEAKHEEKERRKESQEHQKRLEKRETLFDQKLIEFEDKKQILIEKAEKLEKVRQEVDQLKEQQIKKIEELSKLSKEEAQKILFEKTEKEVAGELVSRVKKIQALNYEDMQVEAKKILAQAIEKYSSGHTTETTTSAIALPSDEMKGRIIGREGRNIKTLESLLGVEIVIDDTPESLTVSCFSPIRRQVAKTVLEKLISDGRIHPGRIEEVIEEAKREVAIEIKKAGENTLYELGMTGFDPKLVQILGRLKFRTSYGQNVLKHSIETTQVAVMLAEELGADINIAKKGGLFHDIGKAVDHEMEGTHPEIGYSILKKFKLDEQVALIAKEHHDDQPSSLEGMIVKVADAISSSRPGARKDSFENYIQRLNELEDTAKSFDGVDKCYAIQAGREIRIFVSPEEIDDLKSQKLAREIANKIESDLKYPGEIKVNVIRESRVIEYAR
jgi:ribonucrease Y